MKKYTAAIFLVSAMVLLNLSSCAKYPEGPALSLLSRTNRVSNSWQVENYKLNGDDLTSLVSSYYENFTKEGIYSYSWSFFEGSGTWSFQNDSKEIKLAGTDAQSSRTLVILKLKEDSFWYYYMDGNDKHEYHLVPKK
jgi:hypothetical protein